MQNKTANEIVKLARHGERPTALEFIDGMLTDFISLHGDRYYGDDEAVVGGLAFLAGQPITVIGIQKGRNLPENIRRNFGSPHPEGYRKALRLMKQAEKFQRPVLTLINTAGAFCGVEAEERGEGEAIAKNLMEMSHLKVPMISVIIGEGGSGGALALAVTDEVWMLENSIYAILSPEGFASIMWKDASRSQEAASVMKLTAQDLKKLGVIEKIIPETNAGEACTREALFAKLKQELVAKFEMLNQLTPEELVRQRYQRFRKF